MAGTVRFTLLPTALIRGLVVAVHKLEQIISLLQSEYYIELSESEIVEAMAKGLPEMMDSPHTYYMSPEEYDMSLESDTGRYAGIGATIQVDPNNQVVVSDLYPNGPAEMAGIQIGDVFTAIDGDPIKEGTTAFELSLIVRGNLAHQLRYQCTALRKTVTLI